jgi:hypothetical protein
MSLKEVSEPSPNVSATPYPLNLTSTESREKCVKKARKKRQMEAETAEAAPEWLVELTQKYNVEIAESNQYIYLEMTVAS